MLIREKKQRIKMSKHITIIGAGVSGLCSAYYLIKKGHQVTIIEKEATNSSNCSTGNAGMIVPSHIIPLAAPGMIAKGMKWMFNPQSPFFIRPRVSTALMSWIWKFTKAANTKHVHNSIPILRDYNELSKRLFGEMHKEGDFDFPFDKKGLLMLYQTAAVEKEEKEMAEMANEAGLEAQILSPTAIKELEPHIDINARGAVYFPGDAHITPNVFIQNLTAYLQQNGVQIQFNTSVKDIIVAQGRVNSLLTNQGKQPIDELVICAGAWSSTLAKKIKLNLPLQGGKGYSFDLNNVDNIAIPSILCEAKVAVTPMSGFTRFAGTMEINGTDLSVSPNRVKGIEASIPQFYPSLARPQNDYANVWRGLRPCSPDGLPYLGKSPYFNNCTIATGHAMMGLSMGPATGKLVSQIVDNESTEIDINLLKVSRFA